MTGRVIIAGSLVLDMTMKPGSVHGSGIDPVIREGKANYIDGVDMYMGGEVGNTGIALSKLGIPVTMFSKVGNDRAGKLSSDILSEFPVDLRVEVAEDTITSVGVSITPPGMDRISFFACGASQLFTGDDIPDEEFRHADLFQFGYPTTMPCLYKDSGAGLRRLYSRAKAAGVTTSMDTSLPDLSSEHSRQDWPAILKASLPYVDIFLPSIEETMLMLHKSQYIETISKCGKGNFVDTLSPGEVSTLADELLAMGPKIVMIKMGKRGLYLRTASKEQWLGFGRVLPDPALWSDREILAPAFDTKPILSAIGAGDTAIAGFLAAMLHGASPETALDVASMTAALCIGGYDTVSRIRPYDEVIGMLAVPPDRLGPAPNNKYWTPDEGRYLGISDSHNK